MLLSPEEIKAQLRLDEDYTDEDKFLELLLLTHFYENRSTVTEVEKVELPMSFNWLVGPYRYIPL